KLLFASIFLANSAFADVTIKDAYLRAVPPGQMMSAAFMQLTNNTDKALTIIGGSSEFVKSIEVHNHAKIDGVMKMRRVPGLTIEAGDTTVLKPGGLHIMFIGLKKMIKAGEDFRFELTFDDGTSQAVTLPIKSIIN
ncbi:MAG: copper(I)-binding protein, partial [Oceanospirillaceae bacterium]